MKGFRMPFSLLNKGHINNFTKFCQPQLVRHLLFPAILLQELATGGQQRLSIGSQDIRERPSRLQHVNTKQETGDGRHEIVRWCLRQFYASCVFGGLTTL